jgi:hypothetical protein
LMRGDATETAVLGLALPDQPAVQHSPPHQALHNQAPAHTRAPTPIQSGVL